MNVRSRDFWLRLLLVLLGLKLLLSLLIFRQPDSAFLPDSYGYEDLAVNLIQTGAFDVPNEHALGLIRTPGYPLFIAAVYRIAGRAPGVVILIQLVLDGLTALMILALGRELFSEAVGLSSAWIYALSLNATGAALYLLSDTLFTFLIALALYLLGRYWRGSRVRWIGLSGLSIGLATLVRPIGLYVAPLWIILATLVITWPKSPFSRQGYRGVLVLALGALLLVAPWFVRNYALTGRWILSTAEATNLYCCFAPAALAEGEHISLAEAKSRVDAPYQLRLNEVAPELLFQGADYATEIIKRYPLGYVEAHFKGTLATLFEPTYRQWLQVLNMEYVPSGALGALARADLRGVLASVSGATSAAGWFSLIIPILNGVYIVAEYLLAAWGIFKILHGPRVGYMLATMLILVATTAYLIVAPGPGGGLRFRVPAEPSLSLLAGIGLIGKH